MRRKLLISLVGILVLAFGGLLISVVAGNEPSLGLDLQGGISVTQQPVGNYDPAAIDLAVDRIRDRVDSLGVAEPEIIRQGDAIVVNLPGVKNQQEAIDLVQVTGQVYLRPVLGCISDPGTTDGSSTTTTVAGEGSSTTVAPTTRLPRDPAGGSPPAPPPSPAPPNLARRCPHRPRRSTVPPAPRWPVPPLRRSTVRPAPPRR